MYPYVVSISIFCLSTVAHTDCAHFRSISSHLKSDHEPKGRVEFGTISEEFKDGGGSGGQKLRLLPLQPLHLSRHLPCHTLTLCQCRFKDLRLTYGPHVLKRQSAVDAAFSVSAYFMTCVYHMCHILRYGRGAVKTCCLHGQYRRIFEERPTRCHIASLPPLTHIRCCRHSQPSSTLTPRAPCYILPLVTFPALCCRSLACRARTASAVSAYFRTYATSAPLKRS